MSNLSDFLPSGSGNSLQQINAQSGSYQPTSSDHGKLISVTSSTTSEITLVTDATDSITIGSYFVVGRNGTGSVNFVAEAGATINSVSGQLGIGNQWGKATAIKTAVDTWEISGDLI